MYHCLSICDDMLILGTNIEVIKFTKKLLFNNFDMKDLGVADVILGIKITRTPDGISLPQSHCVNKMIERFKEYGIKENTIFFSHTSTFARMEELEYDS